MEMNDFTTVVFVLFISTVILYVWVSRTQQKRRLEKNGFRTEGIILYPFFDRYQHFRKLSWKSNITAYIGKDFPVYYIDRNINNSRISAL